MKLSNIKREIYLDNAAATPLDENVFKTMLPFLKKQYGNPSALYAQGREARDAINLAREKTSKILNCRSEEIIFTAGGTESNNLAIFGLAKNFLGGKGGHIVTTKTEHSSVLEPCEELERQGLKVTYLQPDKFGFVSALQVKNALRKDTFLVSVMYANNEIGTILPILEIGKIINIENSRRNKNKMIPVAFHTDACQAAGYLDLNAQKLNVDLMSVNGSKIYGPKQSGFLFVRNGLNLNPIIFGGGQERGFRSGTENVAGIVGLVEALRLAQINRDKENYRLYKLRDYFIKQISGINGVSLNGPGVLRLPNNINFSIVGVEGEALQIYFDASGISIGTKSACDSESKDPSHVLTAIGKTTQQANSSIRITLGRFTKKAELDYVLLVLRELVIKLRNFRSI